MLIFPFPRSLAWGVVNPIRIEVGSRVSRVLKLIKFHAIWFDFQLYEYRVPKHRVPQIHYAKQIHLTCFQFQLRVSYQCPKKKKKNGKGKPWKSGGVGQSFLMPVQATSWHILSNVCLSVCLSVGWWWWCSRSIPAPQKYQLLFLSLSVVAGANVYQLQRDSPSVSLGDLGFVTTRHYPDSGERRHLNATCVQDSGFVNFQPRELKGGTPTRLIEYAHYGIPSWVGFSVSRITQTKLL